MIKSTNLTKLSHEDFFQIMNLTLAFLKKENLESLKMTDVTAGFEKAFQDYDTAFKQARKTGLVEMKRAIDVVRDNLVIGFYHTMKALLRFPDENIQQAASRILDVLNRYGGTSIASMRQGAESSAITNALQDIREEDLMITNEKRWTEKLQEENDKFIALHKRQTEKEAEYIAGLLADERKKMDDSFRHLCKTIDSLAFVFGEAAYQKVANNINRLVANAQQTAKQTASARASRKEKADGEFTQKE